MESEGIIFWILIYPKLCSFEKVDHFELPLEIVGVPFQLGVDEKRFKRRFRDRGHF